MTRDRRLLLLLALLTVVGLVAVEARYRQHEEAAPTEPRHHRHRHRHDTALAKRTSQDPDYEDDAAFDADDEEYDEDDEPQDYEARSYYERSYPRQSSYHGRSYEGRYPARYHHRSGHRGWYENDDNDRRRAGPAPRYPPRNHRLRGQERTAHRRRAYPRNREDDYEYSDEEDELDYERPYRRTLQEQDAEKRRSPSWRKHRASSRHPRKGRVNEGTNHRAARRYHVDNAEASSRRFDDWRRRVNASEAKQPVLAKHDRRRHDNDYDYRLDETEEAEDDQDKEEEEDIWDEADGEDDADDEEEAENEFPKSEKKPPLKTYDDIIRRLTEDDPTTPRVTIKRDYRNIKYTGSFTYNPRNISRSVPSTSLNHHLNRKSSEGASTSGLKVAGSAGDRRKDTIDNMVKGNDRQAKRASTSTAGKGADSLAKTKSLEQDYDEYMNSPDTEKEEDLIKAGVEEDSGMQADVTNTDYGEDENAEEDETPAMTRSTGKPITSTTILTTTTTTTTSTTTPRSLVTQHYDYRDPRAYQSGTASQYNGYQPKKEYAPMSAHSAQKWQSLGTREGVKATRGNLQQYNKNAAEMKEAFQYAIKVSREGSCQWPRPRVIPVRDLYPSPSTTYLPHCVILHRCSDDTGCCRTDGFTCVPKHSHRVELSFYTSTVNGSSLVEKLSFYNHTECECKERTEYDSPTEKSSERFSRHYHPSPQPQNMRRPAPTKSCRCPSQFTPRITPEGKCQCHCYENNHNCIKTKRGKGYFSLADRTCIERDICAPPLCEFGEYMYKPGKCPRREDRFEAIANSRMNRRHHY